MNKQFIFLLNIIFLLFIFNFTAYSFDNIAATDKISNSIIIRNESNALKSSQSSSIEKTNENTKQETVEISQKDETLRYLRAENNISVISAAYATISACFLTLSVSYLFNKYVKTNLIEIIKKLLNK